MQYTETPTCKCGRPKTYQSNGVGKRRWMCRSCKAKKERERYAKDPAKLKRENEKALRRVQRWREKNPEASKAYMKEYMRKKRVFGMYGDIV